MMSLIGLGSLLLLICYVSCGIIRQEEIPLLANERISKRSISDDNAIFANRLKRSLYREQFRTPISDDLVPAADTALGYYRRRPTRSLDFVPLLRDDLRNVADLDVAENKVFYPLFHTRRIFKSRNARDLVDKKRIIQ